MIAIFGLLILLAAAGVATAAIASNSGNAHALGDAFVIFGQSVTGLSVGQVFLFGLIVGVMGMLGLAMLLGSFNRRVASRRARHELKGSRLESAALRRDRQRLTDQLDDERVERGRLDAPASTGAGGPGGPTGATQARSHGDDTPRASLTMRERVLALRSGDRHHTGSRADR
jgi:hypothetical protein